MCCHLNRNERPSRRPRRTSVYEVRHLRMFRPGESQWWHWSAKSRWSRAGGSDSAVRSMICLIVGFDLTAADVITLVLAGGH
jgi:hypothetical protein